MSRSHWMTGMFSPSNQLEAERLAGLFRRVSALERAVAIDIRKQIRATDTAVYTLVPNATGNPAPTTLVSAWDYTGGSGVQPGQLVYIMIDYSIAGDPSAASTFSVAAFYLDHAPTSSTDWPATHAFLGGVNPGYRSGLVLHPGKNYNTMPNTMGLGGGFFAIPIKAEAAAPTLTIRAFNPQLAPTPAKVTEYTTRITDITARAVITG